MFLFWLGSPLLRLFGGVFACLFMLSPLVALYTVVLALRLRGQGNQDGMWFAILLLLPLAASSWIALSWLFRGIPLQT